MPRMRTTVTVAPAASGGLRKFEVGARPPRTSLHPNQYVQEFPPKLARSAHAGP